MLGQTRPLGVKVLSGGWVLLGLALLLLTAGTILLGTWAWISTTDATPADRSRALGGLGFVIVAPALLSVLAFGTSHGLWEMRRWAWRVAVVAQSLMLVLLGVRAVYDLSVLVVACIAVLAAALAYLLRSGVRPHFR
jgi:hypothetical protein